MTFLRNMKIRSKLFLGFFLLLAITVIIAAFGAWNIIQVDNEYSYVLEYPAHRRTLLRDIEVAMMDSRRIMNRSSMYASEVYGDGSNPVENARVRNEGIDGQELLVLARKNLIVERIGQLKYSFERDTYVNDETRRLQLSRLEGLEREALYYIDHYIMDLIMNYARAGDAMSTITTTRGAGTTVAAMNTYFDALMYTTNTRMAEIAVESRDLTMQTFYIMIVLTLIGLVLGMVIAFVIASMITKPINKAVATLADVSKGNLAVNIDKTSLSRDEVGVLTRDIYGLVDIVRTIVDDLTQLNHEFHTVGDIEYRIDENKYENSFKEMMGSVNNIVDGSINDVLEMLDAMSKISDGDFNLEIKDLPGKKVVMPQTMRSVVGNLKELYESVTYLAQGAASGQLDVSVDASKFKGGWAELVGALNNLVAAIEKPLKAIEISLNEMRNGNFDDARIEDNFSGTFENVKEALNVTEETIMSYIGEIAYVLGDMAKGDLTTTISRDYIGSYAPIKQALTTILESLNNTMSDIQMTVSQVASGAEEISTSAMHLAEGASRQTASIEELSSSIALIHEKATQASNDAAAAADSTSRSQGYAAAGTESVRTMEATMTKVKESSESISKIIDVITSIAFQTNLLALNASVEAARAGEHGKGFSVVADEVRTLAGRSQQSASDTSVIIEEDTKNVDEGLKVMEEVVTAFETIATNIADIAGLITSIADISTEQLESISIINTNVSEITRVVTDTSATAEESASASEELSSQAEMLRQKVEFFKLR
ncbi:MAG: methyl-accepting chemotaxis protein [Defluviitaleaceae bacterium]|nr:methyl-accepting chemotaxis protein [Defluviitaleaceae bacterium]